MSLCVRGYDASLRPEGGREGVIYATLVGALYTTIPSLFGAIVTWIMDTYPSLFMVLVDDETTSALFGGFTL